MASKAAENRWFAYMTMLRRHMISCAQCKGAVKAGSPEVMCVKGMRLTTSAAHEFNAILDLKREVHKRNDGFFYPCPDVSKHGEAYALAAHPHYGAGVQLGLF